MDESPTTNRKIARTIRALLVLLIVIIGAYGLPSLVPKPHDDSDTTQLAAAPPSPAGQALQKLLIKGRAPKTGYTREQFSNGWDSSGSCDVRNVILARDMQNVTYIGDTCVVATATLHDPYTAKDIAFVHGAETSAAVQIDHVVALSDAWQKGAQALDFITRHHLANDPLELLAVDGPTNQKKGDGDAATWLPPNKSFRCTYVVRQIAVKTKYSLWLTRAEYDAMNTILQTCPEQVLPS